MNDIWTTWHPRALSLMRAMAGFLFLWHGSQKLFGFPPSSHAGGDLSAFALVAGTLELLGGLMLLIGFLTRWTAFLMSGMMAVAYFIAHAPKGFLPIVNKGELAVLYCFVFLYLFFAGGGEWSVDRLTGKKSSSD